jgi:hypothetical protein
LAFVAGVNRSGALTKENKGNKESLRSSVQRTMKTITMTLAVAVLFIISARGQGFLNLNFESAQNLPGNPPIPDGVQVAATNALPDWTAYDGPNALAFINYVSNSFTG